MNARVQMVVNSLVAIARAQMTAHEAGRFEKDLERMCRVRATRDPRDLEREQLLQRHCPTALAAITIDRPSTPRRALKRKRHTWKQLRLPI